MFYIFQNTSIPNTRLRVWNRRRVDGGCYSSLFRITHFLPKEHRNEFLILVLGSGTNQTVLTYCFMVFRGHPLCEFCDMRYMDGDELFRHLRFTHQFCHFCDSDGKHQYYNHMNDLVMHFRDEHYLCDEGDCKNDPLTAAFRTDIDLKGKYLTFFNNQIGFIQCSCILAHIATEHGRYMSKSATKQARTLELEFTLAPRMRTTDSLRNKRRDR